MSFQIATLKGISIKIHFSLVVIFILITWTLANGFMPLYKPNLTIIQYWIMGIIGSIILFMSVLIHEFSHSIVAKSFGIKVTQIILFIFGGISYIEEEPKDFKKEFKIAFAGPASSFLLSGFFTLLWWITSIGEINNISLFFKTLAGMLNGIFFYSLILNLSLGFFNLIPAFPMDGGRILRAFLFKKNNNYERSTRISVKIGVILSYFFFAIGIIIIVSGSFVSGTWIIILGWFLQSGANSYLYQLDVMRILSGIRLEQIMNTKVISIPLDTSLDNLFNNYFSVYMKSSFPIVDSNSHLVGVVNLKDLLHFSLKERNTKKIKDIMINLEKFVVLSPKDTADKALQIMVKEKQDKVFVCDLNNCILGVVSKTDIIEAMDEQRSFIREQNENKK